MARFGRNRRRSTPPRPHFGKATYRDRYIPIELEAQKVLIRGERRRIAVANRPTLRQLAQARV